MMIGQVLETRSEVGERGGMGLEKFLEQRRTL